MNTKLAKYISMLLLMVILLSMAAPAVSANNSPFTDVLRESIAFEAVNWAHSEGLVTGHNGLFFPSNNMTRAQFALVLHRLENRPSVSGSHGFSDVSSSSIANNAITWAHSKKIVTGSNGRFNPNGSITRAQMVLMLHRLNTMHGRNNSSSSTVLNSYSDSTDISRCC